LAEIGLDNLASDEKFDEYLEVDEEDLVPDDQWVELDD
jgi:hypothetical protein